jgi:hypothetical protein
MSGASRRLIWMARAMPIARYFQPFPAGFDHRVDLSLPGGLAFWALSFDVSEFEIQEAVDHVGTAVIAVGMYLRARPFISSAVH